MAPGAIPDSQLVKLVRETFDLRPVKIIERLGLLEPRYQATAAYGHFGRPEFSWEALDYVDALKKSASQLA